MRNKKLEMRRVLIAGIIERGLKFFKTIWNLFENQITLYE